MMNKKIVLPAAIAASMLLAACGGGTGTDAGKGGSGKSVEVFLNMPAGSPQEAVMNDLVTEFEKQEGVDISLTIGPSGFSEDMRVKIASNSIPDVFSTHGWSVMRYAPYLEPLDERAWVKDVNQGLNDIVFDEEGHIYTLPIEYAISGLVVNNDVLKSVGVDAANLTSWDAIEDAFAKVKAAGVTPIVSSAKENAGDLGNFIASGAFTEAQLKTFTDGTFDTAVWEEIVGSPIESWTKADYINPDFVSATQDDMARQLADGSAGFAFGFPFVVATALEYNADADLGFIPLPGADGGYLVGGEGVQSYGVAKDSDVKEEALKFIDFLAQPENSGRLVKSMNAYPGLTSVTPEMGGLQASYDKYVTPGTYPTKPFFDRLYLPSGMWNVLVTTTDGLVNKQLTAADAATQMKQQFDTLNAK